MARKVSGDKDFERKIRDDFHSQAPVPLLITADLEGSRMSQPGGKPSWHCCRRQCDSY